jgi:hypothetical protein
MMMMVGKKTCDFGEGDQNAMGPERAEAKRKLVTHSLKQAF